MRRVVGLTAAVLLLLGAPSAVAAGPATRGYVADYRDNTVVVFDPATSAITDRIPMRDHPIFAVRPDGREIYNADLDDNSVTVISTASNTVVATIPVGGYAMGVAFTPDSRRAYVANFSPRSMSVIDTGTRRVVATIPLGGNGHQPAVSPDGASVYVATSPASGSEPLRVEVFSTATNTVTAIIPLAGHSPTQVVFAPDGRRALVSTGEVIDTATHTVTGRIFMGQPGEAVFADNTHVYVADFCGRDGKGSLTSVDVVSLQVVKTIIRDGNPRGIDLTPDRGRLYVTLEGAGAVAVLDPATDRVVETFGVNVSSHQPLLDRVRLSGTAPPASRPGQRFAPRPYSRSLCSNFRS